MKVKFTLEMDSVIVDAVDGNTSNKIDKIIIEWKNEISMEEMLEVTTNWNTEENFLLRRMPDLIRVDTSKLTIEPLDEVEPPLF